MKNKIIIGISLGVLALVMLSLLINNKISSDKERSIRLTEFEKFEELINNEEVFLINAHAPYIGEIEGTDLIAEKWENMAFYRDRLPKDKNQKIAIYCRSGHMSAIAAKQLQDMGYSDIYDLEGGMNAWQENGGRINSDKMKGGN